MSPFVSLPTATTLSYNYKSMPSAIPPSSLGIATASDDPASQPRPRYVVASSGHAAHPDDIVATCRALHAEVARMQEGAERELRAFEDRLRDRDLAEKRRLAPGWLDSEARLLQPERSSAAPLDDGGEGMAELQVAQPPLQPQQPSRPEVDEGAELDRAFGGMALR